jgi:hypothetical protein
MSFGLGEIRAGAAGESGTGGRDGDGDGEGDSSVLRKLKLLQQTGGVAVVNAQDQRDLNLFTLQLMRAEQAGCRFLYR